MSWETLAKAGRFFWPPMAGDEITDRWRKKITFAFYGVVLMQIVLVLWFLGFLPAFVPRPAFAGDLDQIRADLGIVQRSAQDDAKKLRLGQILPALDDARRNHCLALRAHAPNQDSITLYFGRLTAMEDEYFRLEGRAYPRPDCDAIIVPVQVP